MGYIRSEYTLYRLYRRRWTYHRLFHRNLNISSLQLENMMSEYTSLSSRILECKDDKSSMPSPRADYRFYLEALGVLGMLDACLHHT